ncbi:MAG: iron ABC transporter permease [Candidatus Zophobacter franzmannii]|nr:iron ABC transporter permease [Candidatus Zophobacter franzmannii]
MQIKKSRFPLVTTLVIITGAILVYFFLTFDTSSSIITQQVRLPRLLLGLLVGAILAGCGSIYQMMLNNPLAEPYILGISSGSALFATMAGLSGMVWLMPIAGFAGALLAMFLVWTIAHIGGWRDTAKLLLAGIIAGMFFSACISLLMYLNQKEIGMIINVLMGNLGRVFTNSEWQVFGIIGIISVGLLGYLHLLSLKLNIMSTGDLSAESLGINVKRLRIQIFIITSLLVGVTVSFAGIIGFIGLIIPHIVRMLIGPDQKRVYPLSILVGAIFLVLCDFLAMHLAVMELPVGIITSFLGAPFFVYIMVKSR